MRAVGIFGGTFDPIHRGHMRAASAVCAELQLARLCIVPNADPPHRPPAAAAAEHRIAMARIAMRELPTVEVDARELSRPGPSFTVDTLESFRAEVGDAPLCLILGMDSFHALPEWHRWQELPQLAHIVVMARPDAATPNPTGAWWEKLQCDTAKELKQTSHGKVYFARNEVVQCSASELRRQLAEGVDADGIDTDVLKYIRQHGLYAAADGLQKLICAALEESKAVDLRLLDVRGMTDITDYMIVAGGNSGRHVKALANQLREKLRAMHIRPLGVEGEAAAEWVLLDYGDVVVHLMRAEQRGFYELERLWGSEVRALVGTSRKRG